MNPLIKIITALAFILGFQNIQAQSYVFPSSGTTTIAACSGTLTDDGDNLNYSDNSSATMVIDPLIMGNYVKLKFTSFNLETCCDKLRIYSGQTASPANLIGSFSGSSTFSVVSGDPTGSLTLVFESDEVTNASGFSAEISCVACFRPDLYPSNVSTTSSIVPDGRTFTLNSRVNNENFDCPASYLNYYLSTDPFYGGGDEFLAAVSVNAITAGNYNNVNGSITIPSGTPPGNYYIILRADGGLDITECDEVNNVLAFPITIVPAAVDLTINSISLTPNTVYTGYYNNGSQISGSVSIGNIGNTQFNSPPTAKVWFSQDSILSVDDILVTTNNNNINYGASINVNFSYYPAENIDTGTYYLLVKLDPDNLVSEPDEINNYSFVPVIIQESYWDIKAVSISNLPPIFNFNTNYNVTLGVKNNGVLYFGSQTPHESALYLSSDTLLDLNDVRLNHIVSSSGISSGNTTNVTLSINFNDITYPPGSCYLILVTDPENLYHEIDETNNTFYTPITYPTVNYDDRVFSLTAPSQVAISTNFNISCSVKNAGNYNRTGMGVAYYFSSDTIYDPSDYLLGTVSNNTIILPNNNASISNISVNIPPTTTPGNYYIIALVDPDNLINETVETNNKKYKMVSVSYNLPDIIINNFTCPTTICNGGKNNFSLSISNAGVATATSFSISLYQSQDQFYDASDIQIYNQNYGSLLAGNNATINITDFNVSPSYYMGSGYILVFVNKNNLVNEISLLNNTLVKPVTVQSCSVDLVASLPNVPNVTAGSNCTFSAFMNNGDAGTAYNVEYKYYISSDNILDAGDMLIYFNTISNFHGGDSYNVNYNYTIPLSTTPGNYYGIFVIDEINSVSETNENNNIVSDLFVISAPNVGKDLYINGTTNNTTTTIGDSTYTGGTVTIKNGGTTTSSNSNVGIYLSNNSSFSSDDILIGFVNNGALNAGASSQLSCSAFIPDGTPPGNYYIIYYADYDSLITEYNETNNAYVKSITILDAVNDVKMISNSFPDDTIFSDNSYNYSYWVKNLGNSSFFEGKVTYYLSTDAVPDPTDYVLGNYIIYNVNPGAFISKTENLTISNSIPDGNYYFIYYIDSDSVLNETNETNNIVSIPIYLKKSYPDLELQNYFVVNPSKFTNNTTTNYSFQSKIRNSGETSAGVSTVRFYISQDTLIDGSDIIIGTTSGSTLAPDINYTSRSLNFVNNVTVTPGNYFLIQFVDPLNIVQESNESNNIRYYPFTVYPNYIDLITPGCSVPTDTIIEGSVMSVSYGVFNSGTLDSPGFLYGIFLSQDTLYDVSDISLFNQNFNSLSLFGGNYYTPNITIPGVTPGDYHILFVIDKNNTVSESDETNNLAHAPIHILSKEYEFYSVLNTINKDTTLQNTNFTLSGYIVNEGNSKGTNVDIDYYLSTDTIYSPSDDVYLTGSTATINPLSNILVTANTVIPIGTPSGQYYILTITDFINSYSEINEGNNLSFAPIFVDYRYKDLTVAHNYCSSLLKPNKPTTLNFSCINSGNDVTGNFKVQVFLSEDSLLTTSPNYLLAQSIFLSQAGHSASNNNLTIPTIPNITTGNYYLIYEIDYLMNISETNESNNTSVIAVEISDTLVDVYPLSLNCPTFTHPGDIITINYSFVIDDLINHPYSGKFYLSNDTLFDLNDTYLNMHSLSASPGINNGSSSINIPSGLSTGFYYLFYYSDDPSQISESNENNNIIYFPIYIEDNTIYNLNTISSLNISACSGTIYDAGGASNPYYNATTSLITVSPTTIGMKSQLDFLYLVTESCCDYLKIYNGPDTTSTLIGTFTSNPGIIASTHSSGSLTLLFKSDSINVATGLAANISCISPGIDLTLSNFSINPNALNNNTPTNLNFTVNNTGSISSPSSSVKVFISNDSIYDVGDILLTSIPVSSIGGSGTLPINQNITPNVAMAGNYYIILYVDEDQMIGESDENNNTVTSLITIFNPNSNIDLSFGNCTLSTTNVHALLPFNLSADITNSLGAVTSHSFKVFLSNDTIPSSNDLMVDSVRINSIGASTTINENRSITLPSTVISGSQYLLLFEDADSEVSEFNEINNVKYFAVNVINNSSDVEENNLSNAFSLYPNPANSTIQISYLGNQTLESQDISLYDIAGKLVWNLPNIYFHSSNAVTINVGQLANGMYTIKIGNDLNMELLKLYISH